MEPPAARGGSTSTLSRRDKMTDDRIDAETIRTLARLQGLAVPEEDIEPLAAALRDQLAAGRRILERYGAQDAEPPLVFDPRWR